MPGINGKLNEISAAIGRIMLGYVEGERQKRIRLHEIYNEELADVEGLTLMPTCAADVKLTKEDSGREKEGLAAAMRRFSFNEGFIVTKSQREDIKVDEGVIHVVPFSDFDP